MIIDCCFQKCFSVLLALLVVYISINGGLGCVHTVYMLPLYAETTIPGEFNNTHEYLSACQMKAYGEDMKSRFVLLSLDKNSIIINCTVGDECSDMVNTTYIDPELYMIKTNKSYSMIDFWKKYIPEDGCLEFSTLIIPTNIRCIQVEEYPEFWALIGNYTSDVNKFIFENKLSTNILWINYNYLSPTDNIGCELDYLLKAEGSPLTTNPSDKDGQFLMEAAQLDICSDFKEPKATGLTKPLLIVIVVICSLILLLGLACIILFILKVKYRYKILKMDFLFRRDRKGEEEEEAPGANYYTMQDGLEGDKWELSIGELDIDYDNVLGSGAFAYVVQATLLGQRVGGASRGVGMFNGNLVAVKILHSTADDIAKKNFLREIELMKSFDVHAHLLNLVGCICDPENPMLISELCEVGDLRHVLVTHKPHDIFDDRPQCTDPGTVCLRGKDLTSFAWQVSDALFYLASHQFVHKDIAARNVFITRAMTAKLGDFGLCHSLDTLSALHESPCGKVPMKWTALEALQHGIFSEKSDIWSYGILLFEMYSGAAMPYPLVESENLQEELINGIRPEIPEEAPENMRLIMKSCWLENPEERPTFDEIRTRLSGLLDVCSQAYGYIQFSQQTQPDLEKPSSPTTKQNGSFPFHKEIENNHELEVVQEVDEDS